MNVPCDHGCGSRSCRWQRGQSFIEYMLVVALAVLVLISGNPSPVQMLVNAIHEHFTHYSFAMSISSIPNCVSNKNAGGATMSVDKCVDVNNPDWPVSIDF